MNGLDKDGMKYNDLFFKDLFGLLTILIFKITYVQVPISNDNLFCIHIKCSYASQHYLNSLPRSLICDFVPVVQFMYILQNNK